MVFSLVRMDLSVVTSADEAGFEELTLLPTLSDGDYYLATSFYAAMDLGAQGSADLDFTLGYHQIGVQTGSFNFSAALNTVTNFANTFYLAKLTKAGST